MAESKTTDLQLMKMLYKALKNLSFFEPKLDDDDPVLGRSRDEAKLAMQLYEKRNP